MNNSARAIAPQLLFILIGIVFSASKCKRDAVGQKPVSGIAINSYTGAPFANADIVLVQHVPHPRLAGAYTTKQSTVAKADNDGLFHFNFDYDENIRYQIAAHASQYEGDAVEVSEEAISGIDTLRLHPKFWVKVALSDAPPLGPIKFYLASYERILGGMDGPGQVTVAGDAIIVGESVRNSNLPAHYELSYEQSNGENVNVKVPFTPIPLDTVLLQIDY